MKTDKYQLRLKGLGADRLTYESTWQDVAQYQCPERGCFQSKGDKPNDGNKSFSLIIDDSATQAGAVLVSGIRGGLSSPSSPWLRLSLADTGFMSWAANRKTGQTMNWLQSVQKGIYRVLAQSNFYSAIYNVYAEQAFFGTGPIFIEESPATMVRFRSLTAGEYYMARNADGIVDTLYRSYWMTGEQVTTKWPGKGSNDIKSDAGKESWFKITHCVQPNKAHKPDNLDSFPFESIYYETNTDEILKKGGFFEFPCPAPVWERIGSNVYGSSYPGRRQLGNVKMLQTLHSKNLRAIDKQVDPPTKSTSAFSGSVDHRPGGNTPGLNEKDSLTALYQVQYDNSGVISTIRDTREQIKLGFHNDLFILLLGDRATAQEVVEKKEEKLIQLGPVIENQFTDGLDPILHRVFGIMQRNGAVPPIPMEMADVEGTDIKIEYISLLAQAQKLAGVQSIDRALGLVGGMVTMFPEATDNIDPDATIREYYEMVGVPPRMLRPLDEVANIREGRRQAQEENAALMREQAAAGMAKDLSQTDTEGKNALTDMA